jgi:hypothetical protein
MTDSRFYGKSPTLHSLRGIAMPTFSNIATGDITLDAISGCHDLTKYQ